MCANTTAHGQTNWCSMAWQLFFRRVWDEDLSHPNHFAPIYFGMSGCGPFDCRHTHPGPGRGHDRNGMAHECFLHAKAGNELREGVQVCKSGAGAGTLGKRTVLEPMTSRRDAGHAKPYRRGGRGISTPPFRSIPRLAILMSIWRDADQKGQTRKHWNRSTRAWTGMGFPHRLLRPRRRRADAGPLQEAYYDYRRRWSWSPISDGERTVEGFVVTRVPRQNAD